ATVREALEVVLKFVHAAQLPFPTALVCSGGGWHVYWISDKPLTVPEWKTYAEGLYALALKHGLKCDPVTTDAARILRVPGTFNHKTAPPKPVTLRHLGASYDFKSTLSWLCSVQPVTAAVTTPASSVVANPAL